MKELLHHQLSTIESKIQALREEQGKLQEQVEHSALRILRQNGAFSYDYETLVGGLVALCETLRQGEESLLASWKELGVKALSKRGRKSASR